MNNIILNLEMKIPNNNSYLNLKPCKSASISFQFRYSVFNLLINLLYILKSICSSATRIVTRSSSSFIRNKHIKLSLFCSSLTFNKNKTGKIKHPQMEIEVYFRDRKF